MPDHSPAARADHTYIHMAGVFWEGARQAQKRPGRDLRFEQEGGKRRMNARRLRRRSFFPLYTLFSSGFRELTIFLISMYAATTGLFVGVYWTRQEFARAHWAAMGRGGVLPWGRGHCSKGPGVNVPPLWTTPKFSRSTSGSGVSVHSTLNQSLDTLRGSLVNFFLL